jgi:hypothetical protein
VKFSAKKWKCEGDKDHVIIEVVFDANDIKAASAVADAKVNFINVHNPGGICRPPHVIRNRIIAGKLADAAVAELLNQRIAQLGLSFSVNEYDKTRMDGFEHPDPYDLELNKPGSTQTIEVRSSFCYRLAPPDKIVKKLSIYGWYTSANKPAEPPRDWYWQVIFYLRPCDIPQESGPAVRIFEDELEKGELIGYIVGGASRELLETIGVSRTDQDNAWYRAITPICAGLDYLGMSQAMFGIATP